MSGRRRGLGALITLPWLFFYGISGSWVLARGIAAAAGGQSHLDVGYSTAASPAGAIVVGALIMAAFAIVMAAAVLLLLDEPRRGRWVALATCGAVWTFGAVWAGVSGSLSPALWVIFFFGLVYATVLALLMMRQAGRAARIVSATDDDAAPSPAEVAPPAPPADSAPPHADSAAPPAPPPA